MVSRVLMHVCHEMNAPLFRRKKEIVLNTNIKWLLALGVGVAGGWAARSLSDSPEGAGVKLLEIGLKTKEHLDRWAAVERERLDDMLAEARTNIARENETANKPGHRGSTGPRREARLVKLEERA